MVLLVTGPLSANSLVKAGVPQPVLVSSAPLLARLGVDYSEQLPSLALPLLLGLVLVVNNNINKLHQSTFYFTIPIICHNTFE